MSARVTNCRNWSSRAAHCLLAIALFFSFTHAMTAKDKEEYERRGLSQVEWQMILDAEMPIDKVDELLAAGISITDYFEYPWLKIGISEQEWIRRRRAGMDNADIAVHTASHANASEWAVVQNFLLPGFHQFKRKQYGKGAAMTSIAVLSTGLLAFLWIKEGDFMPAPLLLLIPDMAWSSIDIGFQIRRERNPEANRFILRDVIPGIALSFSFGDTKD